MSDTYKEVEVELVDPVYRLAKWAWVFYAALVFLTYYVSPCW